MNRILLLTLVAVLTSPLSAQQIADQWHQWRGPMNNGVSETANPPLEWSEQNNLGWKAEIGGHGTSSPIIWGDKVFLTATRDTGAVDSSKPRPEDQPERIFGIKHPNTSHEMLALCYHRQTGKVLWRKVARTLVPHEGHHRDASFASASPFCDGERVYFWFGSAGIYAYSLDGRKLWERQLPPAKVGASLGEGSSPVVHDGKIVLARDHQGQSMIEVLDAANGKTVWKKNREEGNAWATPAIAERDGVVQVITCASNQIRAYDLATGEIIWHASGLTGNCTPCPIVDDDLVYCMSGYEGHALLAVPITGQGDVSDQIRWRRDKATPYVPSPLLYGGQLYFTQSNQGILTSVKAVDGTEVFERVRVPELGDVYASPVAAKGRIYLSGRRGRTAVLAHGEEFKVLANNDLDDDFHSSPALAGDQLFLRGMRFLYCLQEGGSASGSSTSSRDTKADPLRALLEKIARHPIPADYPGGDGHQPFVDREIQAIPAANRGEVARLWKAQERLFPEMENRGASFMRILDYVRSLGNSVAPQAQRNPLIKKQQKAAITVEPGKAPGVLGALRGVVTNREGEAMSGVMISAFDDTRRMNVSVFSQSDGRFHVDGLPQASYRLRARLAGQEDQWLEGVKLGASDLAISLKPAVGEKLEDQRPATSAFAQLKFDSPRDKLNFKMMCTYCHQIGTAPFRSPEKPVDWETMITRMDGFGGLYPHVRETIVERIIDTYKDDAVDSWPEYVPPAAPTGLATQAKITSWELGEPYVASFHDLEIGADGLAYVVHIGKQYTATLDPETTERIYYRLPRGSYGPHSIEPDNHGDMWLTLCVSGEMAKFDLETKEYTILSSAEPPAERGSWPHTLRTDPKDPESLVWYTDAGRNSVFSLHPKTLKVKEYHLLSSDQVKAGGKGESRGITPYGLDFSPVDGSIWYSKLNGNRIGRIDPKAPDGNVTEWNPPFRGPRRLHVAQDGMVWVPGFGSGVFAKFDPTTEQWTTYALPNHLEQIPYALNVAPNGMIWICGTGNDTLYRFNPETEYLVEFQLPFRGSYTREIEFDAEGSVWTSTSGPARHMENACGTVIKLEILDKDEQELGGTKLVAVTLSEEEQGIETEEIRLAIAAQLGSLLAKIEARALPKEYTAQTHQQFVDKVMPTLSKAQLGRFHHLWKQRRESEVPMDRKGESYVRILDYVASGGRAVSEPAEPGPGTAIHRLDTDRRSPFDAFAYVNRIPVKQEQGESAQQFAGRIHGRLANQEGRVQLKLPEGMDRSAYVGFKTFLGSEGNPKITNCNACHQVGRFGIDGGSSLRGWKPDVDILRRHVAEVKKSGHQGLAIREEDLSTLTAFLGSLREVPVEQFRKIIVEAEVTDVANGAALPPSIQGRVRFQGSLPKRQPIPMDEASRKLYPADAQPMDESLLVGKERGLANVFVFLKETPAGEWPSPRGPAVIDQQKSVFRPRVQGIRVGQKVVMKNGDPFIHNIRSLSKKNRPFNIAQPPGTPDREKTFDVAEGPVSIKCDFHPWMIAHFWVVDHPFFAVTDQDGAFALPGGLPPGSYQLTAWHEKLGTRELSVEVGPQQGAGPEFIFSFEGQVP